MVDRDWNILEHQHHSPNNFFYQNTWLWEWWLAIFLRVKKSPNSNKRSEDIKLIKSKHLIFNFNVIRPMNCWSFTPALGSCIMQWSSWLCKSVICRWPTFSPVAIIAKRRVFVIPSSSSSKTLPSWSDKKAPASILQWRLWKKILKNNGNAI